jgi:rRNA maturation endonuclease Nob1
MEIITKTSREMFVQILGKLTEEEDRTFIQSQIDALDRKKAKAQERRAEKKREGDELREAIYNVLTDELQTIATIVGKVIEATGDATLTNSKAIPRLSALCELGKVVKEKVKLESGDERTAYKLA